MGRSRSTGIRPADFYLPYLVRRNETAGRCAVRIDKDGYHSVQELAFEPDELAAVGAAGARAAARRSCSPSKARSALRKLAFDVPGIVEQGHG